MTITIGDMAQVLRAHERLVRGMLWDVNPEIDRYAENPDEIVPREHVVDLVAIRPDIRTKKLLGTLLTDDEGADTQNVLLRGIDAALYRAVRKAAIDRNESANTILLAIINEGMAAWLAQTAASKRPNEF